MNSVTTHWTVEVLGQVLEYSATCRDSYYLDQIQQTQPHSLPLTNYQFEVLEYHLQEGCPEIGGIIGIPYDIGSDKCDSDDDEYTATLLHQFTTSSD